MLGWLLVTLNSMAVTIVGGRRLTLINSAPNSELNGWAIMCPSHSLRSITENSDDKRNIINPNSTELLVAFVITRLALTNSGRRFSHSMLNLPCSSGAHPGNPYFSSEQSHLPKFADKWYLGAWTKVGGVKVLLNYVD